MLQLELSQGIPTVTSFNLLGGISDVECRYLGGGFSDLISERKKEKKIYIINWKEFTCPSSINSQMA